MDNNHFPTIKKGAFKDLSVLNNLELRSCGISTIEKGAFINLPRLHYLYLEGNYISVLKDTFINISSSWLSLRLKDNKISKIMVNTIKGVPNLRTLDLRYNEISIIEENAFVNLSNLRKLYLDGNDIYVIEENAFGTLGRLEYLYMDLPACDCNIFSFWSWIKSLRNYGKVTCSDRRTQLSFLQIGDFAKCTNSSCPDDYCSNGGSCSTSSTGDPVCDCDGEWTGDTCTDRSCPDDYCSNGGSCSTNSTGDPVCVCESDWTGAICTELIVDSINLCEENVDTLHTKWNTTVESTLATVACTGDYTGNASRYCSSHGKWKEPNYINCISKSIQHIKEQTAKLLSGDSEYNLVTIILKELENITRDNDDLRSGDLLTSSDILNDIAKYVTNHTDKLSLEQLEIFASLCNNLLDERNRQPWEELVDGGSGGAAPLVNAVTEFNDAFNDVIDSNFSLVAEKENVVMEVGKTSSDEIIVPDRSKTNVTWISDSGTEIKLKLQKNICTGLTGYSSTFYRNVSRLFPEYLLLNGTVKSFNGSYDVNSIIADFTIHGSSCSNYTLIMKFDHLLGNYIRPFCGHWDFNAPNTSNGAWSSFGSRLVDAEDSYTICEYNHTTNFAILMSPGGRPLSRAHHFPLSLISAIGCGVSILFLIITIIIHVVFWRDVSDDGTKVLMNLCVALIISYVIFLAGITQTENEVVCSAIAVAMHYMFLTDFALMLAEGILFVKMVVFIFNKRSIVNQLIPPCWIVPAVIVGISAGVTKLRGYGNHKYCWLSPETNLIWAFIGPALLVITINVIVIIITVYKMMTVKAVAAKTPKEKSKIGLKGIRVMLPLFGVTWVLGTFSLNDDLVMFQYLFAICNSLQGLFIFVFNCCLTDKIRKGYREYLRRRANQMDLKLSTECTNNDNLKTAHRRQNVYTEEMDDTL